MGIVQNGMILWLKKIHDRLVEQNALLATIAANQDRQYTLDYQSQHHSV